MFSAGKSPSGGGLLFFAVQLCGSDDHCPDLFTDNRARYVLGIIESENQKRYVVFIEKLAAVESITLSSCWIIYL